MPDRHSSVFRFVRKLHKWLGLLIGIQLLVWLLSGLVMSIIDQSIAGGRSSQVVAEPLHPLSELGEIVSPRALRLPQSEIIELRLASLMGGPVFRVELVDQVLLFDATTGEEISIDKQRARQLAAASYGGDGEVIGQQWLREGSEALNGLPGPLWRVDFDDALHTRVFVDGADGAVIAHRNKRSSLMDFLLMLHFMDYLQLGSFNNPQIILFAFLTLWLSLSGLLLLLVSFNRRDFAGFRHRQLP